MQKPFQILTDRKLLCTDNMASVVPDLFLGGSTPTLRKLVLDGIPFPTGLQKLLLSATNLCPSLNIECSPFRQLHTQVDGHLLVPIDFDKARVSYAYCKFESPRPQSDRKNRRLPSPTRTPPPLSLALLSKGSTSIWKDCVVETHRLSSFRSLIPAHHTFCWASDTRQIVYINVLSGRSSPAQLVFIPFPYPLSPPAHCNTTRNPQRRTSRTSRQAFRFLVDR
jgi:hypothetical protein